MKKQYGEEEREDKKNLSELEKLFYLDFQSDPESGKAGKKSRNYRDLVGEASAAQDYLRNAERERASRMDPRIPRGGGHTEEEYFALPDDLRVELIDGVFYDMASPAKLHQKIAFEIAKQLDQCIEDHGDEEHCFLYIAPSDVALGEEKKTIVQPDVYVHCDRSKEKITGPHRGTPDFVLEVLSPSNPEHDLWRKRELYRRHGVREYWIVNPAGEKIYVIRFGPERGAEGEQPGNENRSGDTSDLLTTYSFDDTVPVEISGGKCSVDFRKIRRKTALMSRE